jgi:hypothetical protein
MSHFSRWRSRHGRRSWPVGDDRKGQPSRLVDVRHGWRPPAATPVTASICWAPLSKSSSPSPDPHAPLRQPDRRRSVGNAGIRSVLRNRCPLVQISATRER